MGNHLLTNVSALDYLQARDDLYMPITGRANHDLTTSSFRTTFADGEGARPRVSRPVPAYPSNAEGADDRWLAWESNDLQQHAKDATLMQGVLRTDELIDFHDFFQRVVGRAPPAVLYFAQGAQFAASRAAQHAQGDVPVDPRADRGGALRGDFLPRDDLALRAARCGGDARVDRRCERPHQAPAVPSPPGGEAPATCAVSGAVSVSGAFTHTLGGLAAAALEAAAALAAAALAAASALATAVALAPVAEP